MALDITAIWDALEARYVEAGTSFRRISRRRREWAIEDHPVLMILDDQGDETLLSDPDDPAPVWQIRGEIVILALVKDTDDAPGKDINDLVREAKTVLERQPTDPVGSGWTYYSDLEGRIKNLAVTRVEKGAGVLSGQAVARISLEMETNPEGA